MTREKNQNSYKDNEACKKCSNEYKNNSRQKYANESEFKNKTKSSGKYNADIKELEEAANRKREFQGRRNHQSR